MFVTRSGGYRSLVDPKRTNRIYTTHDFHGRSNSKAVEFRFDTTKPEHCKLLNPPCSDNIFSVDKDIHVTQVR